MKIEKTIWIIVDSNNKIFLDRFFESRKKAQRVFKMTENTERLFKEQGYRARKAKLIIEIE